jgi:pimeloyl-ACP methyl ester carboxylesterase
MRIFLLPGLGADERMFSRLHAYGVPLLAPRLLVPGAGEEMEAYARRTAAALGVTASDVVGGSSFGSMVAAAMAREIPVRGLALIGGALGAETLLTSTRGMGLLRLLPLGLLRPLLRSDQALERICGADDPEFLALARTMLGEAPDQLLRRGAYLAGSYRPPAPPRCPIFAIHGGRDRVMAPPPVSGCRIVPGAGHGIAFSHAVEVGTFLREVWSCCGNG